MARRIVLQRERYSIQFETSGNGTYFLVTPGGERGPYNVEDDAKRAAAEWLKAQLAVPGETLQETMEEDKRALALAERKNRARFSPEEAAEEVDELILSARTRAAADREKARGEGSLGQSIARQLRAQAGKNADPEGKPAPKFRFQKESSE